MRLSLFGRLMTVLVCLVMVLFFASTTAMAQQKIKVSGKMTQTYTMQQKLDIGDAEGHAITLAQESGTNASTGDHKMLDGAELVNMMFSDLVKGNGSHQGYVTLTKGGDMVIASWKGTVTTVMTKEGKPDITFKGTFTWIKGMGQYANIQGTGTYSGSFISETTNVADWEGEYFIGK